MPFTKGHKVLLGRKLPKEWVENIRKAKLGDKNPAYNGATTEHTCKKCQGIFTAEQSRGRKYCSKKCSDYLGTEAGYIAKHQRIYKQWGSADRCEMNCPGVSTKFEWANISGAYDTDDRSDWVMLCKSCHTKYDRYKYTLEEMRDGR